MRSKPAPVWVAEVEVGRSLQPKGICRARRPDDAGARILVREDHRVLGFITLPSARLGCESVRAAIRAQLPQPITPTAVVAATGGELGLISVVVCTRDRPEMLAVCLTALQQLAYPRYEVVVVDNAPSTEASRHCFERLVGGDPRFRYVIEPIPGLSRARNRGLGEATAEQVAFTDDDVQVDRWWLHGIAAGFAGPSAVGCVTGLVAPAELDHPAQQYFDRRFSWASRTERQVYRGLRHPDTPALYPYSAGMFGTGANFAVERDLLLRLGGFDEALGAGSPAGGGEDLDVFVRILRAGRPLVYDPSAVVWHAHRRATRDSHRQLFAYGLGLTAFLGKYLLDATTTRDVVARLPTGARHLWRMWSPAALNGRAPVPLILAEAAGMALGPFAYVWGRRQLARPARWVRS